MNKVLIGVMSCERDSANGCHDAIRRTWAAHGRRVGLQDIRWTRQEVRAARRLARPAG